MTKEKTKKILSRLSIPLYMLSMALLDLLFRALYGYVGGWSDLHNPALDPTACCFTLLWILIFGAVVFLLPRTLARIFILFSAVLNCILVVVHAVMYHLFGNFFGFPDLLYAGDGAAFFSTSYLQMRKLLLIVVLLTLAAAIVAAIFLPRRPYNAKRLALGIGVLSLAAVGLLFMNRSLLVTVKVRENMTWSVVRKGDINADLDQRKVKYTEFNSPNACLPMVGLYQYTFRDLVHTFFSEGSRDREKVVSELDAYFDARPIHADNEMTGIFKGKNVIMIMVESLDSWMLTDEYMPNLSALAEKSLRFQNYYTPLYLNAGTFSTEFAALTGIIPPVSGASTDAYVQNKLPAALPALFGREGYRVNSFHSASPSIYNRGAIHLNLGFEAYHSYREMQMQDYMIDSEMLNGYDLMVDRDRPFFSFIITYSGHGPYTDNYDNIAQTHLQQARQAVAASGVTGSADTMEQFSRAVAQIMVTDDFIGGLVERLEASGLMDDTVLIVYGDHYCKYLTDTDFLLSLKGAQNRNLLCNTPLLIYNPNLKAQTIEKYGATVDLYPTVCNLFSLKSDLRCFVGEDLFSDTPGLVYWRDNSFYDGTVFYDGTQSAVDSDQAQRRYAEVHDKLDASWKTFQYDYFFYRDPILTKDK